MTFPAMNPTPLLLVLAVTSALAAPPEPKFRAEAIGRVEIGYGVAIADVDGDKRPDILLADKKQFSWFQNPGVTPPGAQTFAPVVWKRHLLAENLTEKDNVCIAAQDITGDGKCEIAVGAEWNPGDTEKSGAVFSLIAPEDRTQKWEAVKFPSVEPTTHRMRWLQLEAAPEPARAPSPPDADGPPRQSTGKWGLVVLPLHGRGNKNGQGAGVKTMLYHPPEDPRGEWKSEVIEDALHATHNLETGRASRGEVAGPRLAIGGREGAVHLRRKDGAWTKSPFVRNDGTHEGSLGIGELRGGSFGNRREFLAAVEPMHGNSLAVYTLQGAPADKPVRKVLTDQLNEGHALAVGDVLGIKSTQIVVGFRGNPGKPKPIGLRLWTPIDEAGTEWRETVVDEENMACEDLALADLDGDNDLDIVASGRATKNIVIYWNETTK